MVAQQLHPEAGDGFVISLPAVMRDEVLQPAAHAVQCLSARERTQAPTSHGQVPCMRKLRQGKLAAFKLLDDVSNFLLVPIRNFGHSQLLLSKKNRPRASCARAFLS